MTNSSPAGHSQPVVSVILTNARGEVLMQLRDDKPGLEFANCWTLPGGMVEEGETPDECIAREMLEEMELALPVTHIGMHYARRGPGNMVLVSQHIYTGRVDAEASSIPLHEGQELRFFPPDALAGLPIAFDHRQTLEQFYRVNGNRE